MSDRKSAQCMTDKTTKKLELAQVLEPDNAERPTTIVTGISTDLFAKCKVRLDFSLGFSVAMAPVRGDGL